MLKQRSKESFSDGACNFWKVSLLSDLLAVNTSRGTPRAVQFTIKNMQFKKSEGKRPFVRHELRQEDNIKTDPKGITNEVWIEFILFRIRTSSGFL